MKIDKSRMGLVGITTSLILMLALLAGTVFYVFDRLRSQVIQSAELSLQKVIEDIEEVMTATAIIPGNVAWMVQEKIKEPDAMFDITRHIVENNEPIVGCAIAFAPDFYPRKGYYFSPYSYRDSLHQVRTIQMGNPSYDYFSMDWFVDPYEQGRTCWSEPYFDEGGGEMPMTTCSVPVKNEKGEVYAVATADISLDALSSHLSSIVPYEGAMAFLVGKDGTFISHPDRSWILKKNLNDMAEAMGDERILSLGKKMLAGESGTTRFQTKSGAHQFIVYAPLSNKWSVALVCPLNVVFSLLHRINRVIWIFLIFIAFLIWMVVRYIRRTAGDKMRMESELNIASGIQDEMLAKNFPTEGPVDLYAALKPARETGGDLYDFYLKGNKVHFAIGDVSGKGVPAALFMAITRSVIRFIAGLGLNPEQIVSRINHTFYATNSSSMFVTLFVGTVDLDTMEMSICNAGHNPILLMDPDEGPRYFKAHTNVAAGLVEDFPYRGETLTLKPGTRILLYTDGVTEAENAEKEQYGEQRLLDFAASQPASLTAREWVDALMGSVKDFAGKAPQNDDITILYIKF